MTYEIVIRYRHELVTATVTCELLTTALRRAKDQVSRDENWPLSELCVEYWRSRPDAPADGDYEMAGKV